MIADLYASETMIFRMSGDIDNQLHALDKKDPDYRKKYLKVIVDYNAECAIAKVFSSEVLRDVVDECLQVFGGYGFTQEYPAERFYRDERINRIFEGTNEINRLLLPDAILKKAMKGELPLMQAGMKAFEGLMNPTFELPDESVLYSKEFKVIENVKQIINCRHSRPC